MLAPGVSGVGDSGWTLLSNHGKVLLCIARDPEMRVTDIAAHAGIKERAVQRILADLRADGVITSTRQGRRNRVPRPRRLDIPRREVDEAMRSATQQLSQVTTLLAIVTAPPIATATVKHIELLALQPQLAMVVVITSTGGVTKRVIPYDQPLDHGLLDWARSYLNEELGGMSVGARMLQAKLNDASLAVRERDFLTTLAPAFTELEERSGDTLYVDRAARLLSEDRVQELSQLGDLMEMLEQRVALLSVLRHALDEPRVFLRIGEENEARELKSLSIVASG